jgi:hypothetical protein
VLRGQRFRHIVGIRRHHPSGRDRRSRAVLYSSGLSNHTPNGRRRVARAGICKSVPFRTRSISVSRRSSAGNVLRRCCRKRATSSPSRRISPASAAGQRLGTPRFRPAPTRAPPWVKRGLETFSTVIMPVSRELADQPDDRISLARSLGRSSTPLVGPSLDEAKLPTAPSSQLPTERVPRSGGKLGECGFLPIASPAR